MAGSEKLIDLARIIDLVSRDPGVLHLWWSTAALEILMWGGGVSHFRATTF